MLTCDATKSLMVAQEMGARPRQCWHTSVSALLRSGTTRLRGAVYVEGWIAAPSAGGVVIEHGWLEHRGTVIDATMVLLPDVDVSQWRYFPGVRYPRREVMQRLRAQGMRLGRAPEARQVTLPFVRQEPSLPPAYRAAYLRARMAAVAAGGPEQIRRMAELLVELHGLRRDEVAAMVAEVINEGKE